MTKVNTDPAPATAESQAEDPAPQEARPEQAAAADTLEQVPQREPAKLLLGDPFADSQVHSAYYAALPEAMDAALQGLSRRYPGVDRGFAARFLELAVSVGVQVPAMTYSHEAWHFREAARQGADPSIEMTGWMSGLTYYHYPGGQVASPADAAAVAAAGVNQEQLNALYMYERWARNGATSYVEALGYLLAQTNLALYSTMTAWYQSRGVRVADSNDIRAYLNALQQRGESLGTGQLTAMALATDLASAPVWASIVGQVRRLATGEREVRMPVLELGDVKLTFPNTHMLLTPEGPILGADLVVGPDRSVPVKLSLDVRTDLKAVAVGAKLYDLKVAEGVTVNPFLRASLASGKPGLMVGAEVRAEVGDGVAITGSVEFRHDDLLAGPEGQGNCVTANVGVTIPLD